MLEAYVALVDAALDGWLTTGRFNDAFEALIAARIGVTRALTTNSGSSANLLALSALTSPQLGERALKPGDEVITVAAGFPTTVNPDPAVRPGAGVRGRRTLPTYNIDPGSDRGRHRPAHARHHARPYAGQSRSTPSPCVGSGRQHDLWLIEDCCDALGSTYDGRASARSAIWARSASTRRTTSRWARAARCSPTIPLLARIVESFRDWGRDCYCAPGKDNTCGKRFDWQLGDLPRGYDHKYIYSHAGYNLKITDMQAALGVAQIDRLDGFIAARRRNFAFLRQRLAGCEEFLILPRPPKAATLPGSDS